jgi:hypothetical protein
MLAPRSKPVIQKSRFGWEYEWQITNGIKQDGERLRILREQY